MSLPGRWSRHVVLVVAAAVLLGLATLIGGIGSSEVPGDVGRALESSLAQRQADAVAPLQGGVEDVDYTSYRSTSSVADVEATVRLWTDDGSGRTEQTARVSATLERGDDGWQVTEVDGLEDSRADVP